jgi:signal peptidase II
MTTGPDTSGSHKNTARPYVITLVGVAAFVLTADAVSKAIVVARLPGHAPIRLLGGLLTLRLLRNSGAAFSIGTSMTIVFTAIAVGVIIFILRTARRLRSMRWAVTLGLLLGGATGNLADRLLRSPAPLRGSVVDWIELPHWPVFNLADSAIVCGGVLAVLLAVLGLRMDGSREVARPPGTPPPPETLPPSEASPVPEPPDQASSADQATEPSKTG